MEKRNNAGGFEAPPPYAYPPQGQGNVPPGEYPPQMPPPGFGYEQKVPLYPAYNQDQSAVVIPPGPYGVPQQHQAVIFVPGTPLQNPPQDHLGYSIFVTICCCWIVGLFAIIKSAECRSAVAAGDRTMAELKSRQAKKLAHIALGLGIFTIIVSIAIIGIYIGLVASNINRNY